MDSQQVDTFIKCPVKCIAAKKYFSGKGQALIYIKTLFLQVFFYKDYFNKLNVEFDYLYIKDFMRMKKLNKLWLLTPLLALSSCVNIQGDVPTHEVVPYQEDMIALQNLYTRVVAYCYSSAYYSAEHCAENFEKKGFVRLNEIPRVAAEYDKLKADTYPTRRWRKDELVPRG